MTSRHKATFADVINNATYDGDGEEKKRNLHVSTPLNRDSAEELRCILLSPLTNAATNDGAALEQTKKKKKKHSVVLANYAILNHL